MRPVIGINGDVRADAEPIVRLRLSYVDAVRRAGGAAVVLPACAPEDVPVLLERLDAVILTGGGDIDTRPARPLHAKAEPMDPRRQTFDLALARALLQASIPALGICLGMQELAAAAGAPLHQHLPDAGYAGLLDHRAPHEVALEPGSRLAEAVGCEKARIVSHHHQAVAAVPAPLRQVASAPDGVVEAFELPGKRFLVGVQWHPERSPDAPETRSLFHALVAAARERR